MPRILRFLFPAILVVTALISAGASAATSSIAVLHVDGTIVPVIADYIDRGLDDAESDEVSVCIIELSTPGGLMDTTQDIVDRILDAKVPVVVYVSRWAGSAGTFITIAAHVAAMAPASRIGAAHPVAMGTSGEQIPEAMEEKITEDAAAWIRSIAEMRGRNPEYAEMAVRQSKSYSAEEALEYNLIDIKADNLPDLIAELDGRKVTLSSGEEITIRTAGHIVNPIEMSGIERILHTISDPNIAYILLSLGMLGLMAELFNPGMIFPGVAGGISLLLAFYSLGVLDAFWGGIILILLAFGLFIAEMFTPTFGLLTAGGVVSLTIGSIILFSGRSPLFTVDPWVIAGVVVAVTVFSALVIYAVVRAHRHQATTGREGLVGEVAVARTALNPEGTIFLQGELWKATAEGDKVEAGEEVIVTKVEGLKLTVTKK